MGERDQMQVVIAQYHDGVRQLFDEAQRFQLLWTAIHKIAGKPQLVIQRIKLNELQYALQLVKTTLNITNDISCHRGIVADRP